MRVGASLVLVAIGAILKFAVTRRISGVDVQTIGVILMAVGVVGLLITLLLLTTRRRTDVIQHSNGTTLLTPSDAGDPVDRRY